MHTRRRPRGRASGLVAFLGLVALGAAGSAAALADGEAAPPSEAGDPAATPDGTRWSVRAGFHTRWLRGRTEVREFASRPARLDLQRDLELDPALGLQLAATADGERWGASLRMELFFVRGRGSFAEDFAYDEGSFRGGRPFWSAGQLLFLQARVRYAVWTCGPLRLGPTLGLEYAQANLGIRQPGVDDTAESYHQFVPYPVIGVAGSWRPSADLTLEARALGTYVSHWSTPFREGGTLHMTARTIRVEAEVLWRLRGPVHLYGGVDYVYWDGRLDSHEDGNQLTFAGVGLTAGLALAW